MPIRALIIGEFGTCNGGENSLLSVLPHLQEQGCVFQALAPIDSEFSQSLDSAGCPTNSLNLYELDGTRKSQGTIRTELAESISQFRPDLVHCNSLSTSRLVGPVVQKLKTPGLGYLRDIIKLSKTAIADINQLDQIVAVSNATKDWHCRQGMDRKKISTIYNGIDGTKFFPTPISNDVPGPTARSTIRKELQLGDDEPLLLFVGQIGIRKGIDTLVKLFLDVADTLPNIQLLIVGQRHSRKQEAIDYEQRIIGDCRTSKHHQKVHWLGHRSDVASLMRESTLLIHPARQEPLGRVLLEAAASGLPMITTNRGGTPEILTDRDLQQRLMFDPDDIDGMRQSVLELLRNPSRIHSIRTQLRELALQRFSVSRCADQLFQCYQSILDSENRCCRQD